MRVGFPYSLLMDYNKARAMTNEINEWLNDRGFKYGIDVQAYMSPTLFALKKDLMEVDTTNNNMMIFGFADVDVYTEFKLTWM